MKKVFFIMAFVWFPLYSQSQRATFMGSSLIHMPSTEAIGKDNLLFRFNHRFQDAKSGVSTLYGLDGGANVQLSLDYGITDKWSVGIARTSFAKTWETRTKYQITEEGKFPVSISFFGTVGQETSKQEYYFRGVSLPTTGLSALDTYLSTEINEYELSDSDKRSYLSSFLISKKLSDKLSLQISPMYVHRNFVKSGLGNSRTGIDIGGRYKVTQRFDLTWELILTPHRDYIGESYATESTKGKYNTTRYTADEINTGLANGTINYYQIYTRNILLAEPVRHLSVPFSFGFDMETGGHVFQLFITNSQTLAHTQLLRGAELDYSRREWSIGFNIHRQFSLAKPPEDWK